jgi:branched-subunit amino acid ABC-type transport system permease component
LLDHVAVAIGFGLITASIVALAAVGITLQFGITNYINFAYGSYATLAAFLAWELNTALHLTFWLAVLLSATLIGFFAVLVSRLLLERYARRNPPAVYMLVATLGLWMMLSSALVIVWGPEIRHFDIAADTTLRVGPWLFTSRQLEIMAIAGVALVSVHLMLSRTQLGKQMRAMSDDRALAQVSGINTDLVVSMTWLVSGFLVGLAGCALALLLSGFQVQIGDSFLFVIFAAVILGGIGQPYGAMLGALIVGLATELSASFLNSAYKTDFAFLLLIITLFIRPQGLLASRGRH